MCRTSIRYQVQDSQRVQERRGDDEWAGTDAVGVEWCRRTGPGRPDWLHRSICLSRAIAHSELTDILTHRLWDGYPLSLQARARVRTHIIPSQEAPPVRSSCAASTTDLHTSSFHRSSATVSVGDGLKYWRHSTRSERPVRLMTPSLPTAPQVYGVEQSAREGSPRHFRLQGGELSRRRSAGGCRFEGLLGS